MGGRTELDVEAHALGLVRERIHAAADPGLCFGAIRRRLARGHLTPNEPVLVGTWAGKSVLVHVVDRRPELRPHENGVPELYLSVSAEIDPPILAAATLATFGSVRLPTGLSVAKTPVRHHGIARVFHVTAANPERLDAFLGDTDDFAFGDALTTAAGALGDLVVADGLVEVNQPLASRPKLRHLADGVTRVAHLVSERSSRLPELPALAAWKSEWLALAESQGLAFEGARARIAGSVLGDQVELVVEPAYQHFETVLAVRFRMPLEGPFQLESHVPALTKVRAGSSASSSRGAVRRASAYAGSISCCPTAARDVRVSSKVPTSWPRSIDSRRSARSSSSTRRWRRRGRAPPSPRATRACCSTRCSPSHARSRAPRAEAPSCRIGEPPALALLGCAAL